MPLGKDAIGVFEKEDPENIVDASDEQRLGTPTTPQAAKIAGGTPGQAAMMGTPQNREGLMNRQKEQDRSKQLSFQKRYQKEAGPTSAQQAAQERMDRLSTLGTASTQIEALIEQNMQNLQQQQVQATAAQDAIEALPSAELKVQAKAALDQYMANPTEQNLKAVYDTLGEDRLVEGGMEDFITPTQQALEGLAQQEFTEQAEPTIGQFDFTQMDVDQTQLAEALDIPEQDLQNMTVQDLRDRVEAIRAEEFETLNQIQTALYDPNVSPARREEMLDQIRQMGKAGIPGVEAAAAELEGKIDQAETLEIAGQEMSLEEAFSDEGFSKLISQATLNKDFRERLREDDRYSDLAQWIDDNEATLESVVADYTANTEDFIEVQEQYRDLKGQLGDASDELFEVLTGEDPAESIMSGDFQVLQAQVETDPVFQAAKGNNRILSELKQDTDLAQTLADSDLNQQEIEQSFELRDKIQSDPAFEKLTGLTPQVFTSETDLQQAADLWNQYEEIEDRVKQEPFIQKYIDRGKIDLDTLSDLNDLPEEDFEDRMAGIENWETFRGQRRELQKMEDTEDVYDYVFQDTEFSSEDVNYAIRQADGKLKDKLKSVFDINQDGEITDDEINSSEVADRLKSMLGADTDLEDIFQGEDYDPNDVLGMLREAGIDSDSFERAARTKLSKELAERSLEMTKAGNIPRDPNSLKGPIEEQRSARLDKSKEAANRVQQYLQQVYNNDTYGWAIRDRAPQLTDLVNQIKKNPSEFNSAELKEKALDVFYTTDPITGERIRQVPQGVVDQMMDTIEREANTVQSMVREEMDMRNKMKEMQKKREKYNQTLQKLDEYYAQLDSYDEEKLAKLMKDLGVSL